MKSIATRWKLTYGWLRLKAVLIFKMSTQGCDVKIFIAVWAREVRSHILITIHIIKVNMTICKPITVLMKKMLHKKDYQP
jgi:hypothetical protein